MKTDKTDTDFRLWCEGRHMMIVYTTLLIGMLSKLLMFLESTVVLGHSALPGGLLALGSSDVVMMLCLLIAGWGLSPVASYQEAIGRDDLASHGAQAGLCLLAYAVVSPCVALMTREWRDAWASMILTIGLNMMTLAVVLLAVGSFGRTVGSVAAGTVVFALLATAQWQIEWMGFSVFPSDLDDHVLIRLCCYAMLDLLGVWVWEISRIGAGPLAKYMAAIWYCRSEGK